MTTKKKPPKPQPKPVAKKKPPPKPPKRERRTMSQIFHHKQDAKQEPKDDPGQDFGEYVPSREMPQPGAPVSDDTEPLPVPMTAAIPPRPMTPNEIVANAAAFTAQSQQAEAAQQTTKDKTTEK